MRQQAEGEKKKAEEERRLRVIIEKDSASVTDQLAKVFQRLGAVENKQKADKKEVKRLQNEVGFLVLTFEMLLLGAFLIDSVNSYTFSMFKFAQVKLSTEGMRVAAQAVEVVQSSLQNLESKLLKKVMFAISYLRAFDVYHTEFLL